jgi:plasmid maintenance system killer protein
MSITPLYHPHFVAGMESSELKDMCVEMRVPHDSTESCARTIMLAIMKSISAEGINRYVERLCREHKFLDAAQENHVSEMKSMLSEHPELLGCGPKKRWSFWMQMAFNKNIHMLEYAKSFDPSYFNKSKDYVAHDGTTLAELLITAPKSIIELFEAPASRKKAKP